MTSNQLLLHESQEKRGSTRSQIKHLLDQDGPKGAKVRDRNLPKAQPGKPKIDSNQQAVQRSCILIDLELLIRTCDALLERDH